MKFAENIKRSLFSSKAYFSDIVNNRFISTRQTIFLGVLLSIVFSIIISSYFYHYRFNRVFDCFISHFVYVDVIKEILGRLAWQPFAFILCGFAVIFGLMLITSLLLSLWSVFCRISLSFKGAFHLLLWSGVPLLLLLPCSMILYPALQYNWVILLSVFVIIIFIVWYIIRLIFILAEPASNSAEAT